MAKIVLGLGTSHSPMVNTLPDVWDLHRQRDEGYTDLHFRGNVYSYQELSELRKEEPFQKEVVFDVWKQKHEACQKSIDILSELMAEASPDVVIIFGNDHKEQFSNDPLPSLFIGTGDIATDYPPDLDALHPSLRAGTWGTHAETREDYPVDRELAVYLTGQLAEAGFDVTTFSEQREGKSLGHAFTFIRRRIMKDRIIPMIPIGINANYPPNQLTPTRCYELGSAVRNIVEQLDSDKRICIVGSGGISHFVVDEQFDRRVITAMKSRDKAMLTSLPNELLESGTAETRNWIAAAAALEGLNMELIQYVPAYRSTAGTGCGLTFAKWV